MRMTQMVALAALTVGSLATQPTLAEGKRLTLLMGPTQDRLLNGFAQSVTAAASAKNMSVTLLTSPYDPALQAQQIDDAIAQKPDMIILQPLSSKAVIPALERAKAAGIPVFLAVTPIDGRPDLYVGAVGLDDYRAGTLAAESLIEALTKSGRKTANVAAITGSLTEGTAPVRLAGFKDRLAKESWIKLVEVDDAQWNPQKTEAITGQLIARSASNGGLDGIYGMNDAQANAIIQAAEETDVTPGTGKGNLIVVGGSCWGSGIRNIKAGKQYATLSGPVPSFDGPATVENVSTFLGGSSIPKLVVDPLEVVTAANLDKFTAPCSF